MNSNHILLQKAFFKGRQEFELDGGALLRVKVQQRLVRREYTVPLGVLEPEPSFVKFIPKQWLLGCCLFGLPIFLSLIGAFTIGEGWIGALLGLTVIIGPLFIICAYKLAKEKADICVFHNRFNGENVLVLWKDLPNSSDFGAFVGEIQKAARNENDQSRVNAAERSMVGELKELRSLMDKGILSQDEYDLAKKRIIGTPELTTAIGFRP